MQPVAMITASTCGGGRGTTRREVTESSLPQRESLEKGSRERVVVFGLGLAHRRVFLDPVIGIPGPRVESMRHARGWCGVRQIPDDDSSLKFAAPPDVGWAASTPLTRCAGSL